MMLQTPVPPVPPPPFDPNLMFLNGGMGPGEVMALALVLIAATVILWPIMRALGRRLEGRHTDAALQAEVERLQHRLEEMDGLQGRVGELEERLDFAERLLAQAQQPARLGAPTEAGGR